MKLKAKSRVFGGVLAGACLYAFAATAARAEDGDAPAPAQDDSQKKDDAKKDDKKSAREDAVKALPAWESYGAGAPTGEASMEETFFRLSRDFVMTSDEGMHRLGAVPIWPRGELRIGGFRILPYLREGAKWDWNYYKQPETGFGAHSKGRRSEWTHQNEAGLLADTALMGGRLGISASIDSIWNVRYGHNAPPDTWDFEGQIGATYRWPSSVWISVGYRYNRTHDVADLPPVSNDFGRRTHGAFASLGFDKDIFFGSKIRWEFGVRTKDVAATDPTFADVNRTETTVYAKASYPFLKRDTTRVFVLASEQFAQRDSEAINNGKTFSLSGGIEGSIPLREGEYRGLRGQVSIGFQRGVYENNTFRTGSQTFIADNNSQSTTLEFLAALQYVMSPRTTVDLRYSRDAEFSFRGNYQLVDRIELSASHTFSRQLTGRVEGFYEHQEPDGRFPQEPLNGIDLSAPSPNVNREGGGVGLRYAVNEWMDLDVNLSVENRNDHTIRSFRNYEGILGITFYLNALTSRPRAGLDR